MLSLRPKTKPNPRKGFAANGVIALACFSKNAADGNCFLDAQGKRGEIHSPYL